MKFIPLGEGVLLERIKTSEFSGPIYVPEIARHNSTQYARVKALGTGKPGFQFTVKPGDMVVLPIKWRPDRNWDGKDIFVLKESELLAIA